MRTSGISRIAHRGVNFGQSISTPCAVNRDWNALSARACCGPARGLLGVQAVGGERPGGLADGPLDGVQAVAAVGDVGDAQVLAGRQQVLDPPGDQGAERDLERQRADVDVVVAAGARVQVDPVAADADGVGERLGRHVVAAQGLAAGVGADVLLEDGELGLDAPRLADVRVLGQAVGRADEVGPEPQALPAGAAVGPGDLGLEPVEERQAQLLGPGDVLRGLLGRRRRSGCRASSRSAASSPG